jgi:hypothetical protein
MKWSRKRSKSMIKLQIKGKSGPMPTARELIKKLSKKNTSKIKKNVAPSKSIYLNRKY